MAARLRDRAAAVALALAATLSACPAFAKEWTTIRIGSEGAYPPFSFIGPDQRLQGFDIEIAKAVCEHLKVRCDFVEQDFQGLIPALLAGKFDAVFASLSITDERRKVIAFSDKYYASPALFVVAKADAVTLPTPQSMAGKAIGAQEGTVSARYLEEMFKPAGAEVRLYLTQDEANLDLASGRVDAVLGDKVAMLPWLEAAGEGECCQVVGKDIADPAFFGDGIGAGLRKQDADLKALIDRGIAAIRADGSYDRINAKYFPFSIY